MALPSAEREATAFIVCTFGNHSYEGWSRHIGKGIERKREEEGEKEREREVVQL